MNIILLYKIDLGFYIFLEITRLNALDEKKKKRIGPHLKAPSNQKSHSQAWI